MEKQLLNRKIFKAIKKYDRQQMEDFFKTVYEEGFKDGFQEGAKTGQQVDFKIQLVDVLQHTKGVGEKTIQNVLNTLKDWEKANETVKNLAAYKERGISNES